MSLLRGAALVDTVRGMAYPSHLTDDQWDLLEPLFNAPDNRRRRHGDDLRTAMDAMLYVVQTGCLEEAPSMAVIDTHLARGASNGGSTFHDRGGLYGRTKGAKRRVAIDVTGLPLGALVVPASIHENPGQRADAGAPGQAGRHLAVSNWSLRVD